jgi:hypothetical protein
MPTNKYPFGEVPPASINETTFPFHTHTHTHARCAFVRERACTHHLHCHLIRNVNTHSPLDYVPPPRVFVTTARRQLAGVKAERDRYHDARVPLRGP